MGPLEQSVGLAHHTAHRMNQSPTPSAPPYLFSIESVDARNRNPQNRPPRGAHDADDDRTQLVLVLGQELERDDDDEQSERENVS